MSVILACPPSVSATWSMSCLSLPRRRSLYFVVAVLVGFAWCVLHGSRGRMRLGLFPLSAVPARSLFADDRLLPSSTPLPVTIVFAVRIVSVIGRDPRPCRKPIRKNEQTGPRTLCNARSAGMSSVRVVTSLRSYSALLAMLGVVRRGSRVVVVVFACSPVLPPSVSSESLPVAVVCG